MHIPIKKNALWNTIFKHAGSKSHNLSNVYFELMGYQVKGFRPFFIHMSGMTLNCLNLRRFTDAYVTLNLHTKTKFILLTGIFSKYIQLSLIHI